MACPGSPYLENKTQPWRELSIRVPGLESIMLDAEIATIHEHDLKFFSPIPFVKTLA